MQSRGMQSVKASQFPADLIWIRTIKLDLGPPSIAIISNKIAENLIHSGGASSFGGEICSVDYNAVHVARGANKVCTMAFYFPFTPRFHWSNRRNTEKTHPAEIFSIPSSLEIKVGGVLILPLFEGKHTISPP
jgi:hypothetical protein